MNQAAPKFNVSDLSVRKYRNISFFASRIGFGGSPVIITDMHDSIVWAYKASPCLTGSRSGASPDHHRAPTRPLKGHGDACRQGLILRRPDGSGAVAEEIVTRGGDRFDVLTNLGRRVRMLDLFESSLDMDLAGSESCLVDPPL